MSAKPEPVSVSLEELNKAIDLVAILMGQVTIPASRAKTWVAAEEVLGVLKEFLAEKQAEIVAQNKLRAEAEVAAKLAEEKAAEAARLLTEAESLAKAAAESQSATQPDLTVVPTSQPNALSDGTILNDSAPAAETSAPAENS